jgi:hypothetical protein
LLLCIPSAAAIGISPAILQLDYAPGKTYVIPFMTYDAAHISIYLRGDLAGYATIDDPKGNGTGPRSFTVALTLPADLMPAGPRRLLVGVIEEPPPGAMIGGRAAYQAPVDVFVPYPGIYLDANLVASSVNINETEPFNFQVINRGRELIVLKASITVFDDSNATVGKYASDETVLNSSEEHDFLFNWDTTGNKAGPYHAAGIVTYDGGSLERDAGFTIGQQQLRITGFTRMAVRGGIIPFAVNITSEWNSPFTGVYADVNINGTTFRTPSVDLDPAQSATLTGYWDLTVASLGTYHADIRVPYGTTSAHASGDVIVTDKESGFSISVAQLTIIIGLLFVLVLLILLLRRRDHR